MTFKNNINIKVWRRGKCTVSAGTSQTASGLSLTRELNYPVTPTWTKRFVQTATLNQTAALSSAEHQAAGHVMASRNNIQSVVMLCFHYQPSSSISLQLKNFQTFMKCHDFAIVLNVIVSPS